MKLPRVAAFAIALLTLTFVGTAHAAKIKAFKADAKEIAKTTGARGYHYRVIVVVEDDAVANEVDRVEVRMAPVGDAPPPLVTTMILPLKVVKANGNKRFVSTNLAFDGGDDGAPLGASYVLSVTMRDVAGAAVGATVTSTVKVDAGRPIAPSSVTIRRLDATNFKLRVAVSDDDDHEVHSVDVIFVDFNGPAPIPTEVSLVNPTSDGDKRVFVMKTMTFEDPAAAVGATYNVVIDLKDASGKSIDNVRTWAVLVNSF